MRWPVASGRRRRGQEPTDRTLPFRPETCLCQSAATLTSVRMVMGKPIGTDVIGEADDAPAEYELVQESQSSVVGRD